jgi:hypothetical protein
MSIFEQYLDNLRDDEITLRDFRHADRLFIEDGFKHAPKQKFLYHITFFITDTGRRIIPELANYTNEVGILVKSADLPSYQAQVEVKNKYNRKKNIQTAVSYNEVSIDFHDDNYGVTTALLEAYFKYYFADSKNSISSGAYGTRGIPQSEIPDELLDQAQGDTLYKGEEFNRFKFGMDNDTPNKPFFDRIEISQLSRRTYTKYTLVNPLITDWSHDTVDYSDTQGIMQNSISVAYETVLYERGSVEGGPDGDPVGFGTAQNYDQTPSPLQYRDNALRQNRETVISDWAGGETISLEEYTRRRSQEQELERIFQDGANVNELFQNPAQQSSIPAVIPKNQSARDTTAAESSVSTEETPRESTDSQPPTDGEIETLAKSRFIRRRTRGSRDPDDFTAANEEWKNLPAEEKQPLLDDARQDLENE